MDQTLNVEPNKPDNFTNDNNEKDDNKTNDNDNNNIEQQNNLPKKTKINKKENKYNFISKNKKSNFTQSSILNFIISSKNHNKDITNKDSKKNNNQNNEPNIKHIDISKTNVEKQLMEFKEIYLLDQM